MKKQKEENNYIVLDNKNKVRDLQNFYVNAEIENLPQIVDEKKNDIVNKLNSLNKHISI